MYLQDDPDENTDDLLDFAAACTIVNGGRVFLLAADQLPDGVETAALFYYEVMPLAT